MPRIQYIDFNFKRKSKKIIQQANEIISEYNFPLTLRQLYYQFVSRDFLPNSQKSYKNLGSIINDARLAGLIDWNSIEDLTRELRGHNHWDSPEEIVNSCVASYREELWADQPNRVEVWVEKDALRQVVARTCDPLDVPYFSCRGYTSQSEVWGASQRFSRYIDSGQAVHVIHLGDHDPSGIDMTRDIRARLEVFLGPAQFEEVTVHRIALNKDQIKRFKPPPNPTKLTDSRAKDYIRVFGRSSWELDALEPKVLDGLIRDKILDLRHLAKWKASYARQEEGREKLRKAAEQLSAN